MNLQEQAGKMAEYYKGNPKLEVVFLGGSVSREWEDRFSDIELFLLWKEPPSDEDRSEPIRKADGEIISFHPYEDQEWSETYLVEGTKFEISSFMLETVEQYINDIKEGDLSLEKQCLIGAVVDGKPFKGSGQFKGLQDRIQPYPDCLKKNLIEQAFEFGGPWQNREALVYREDILFLQKSLVDVSMKIFLAMHALNGMYIHHPGLKWLKETSDRMERKPERFVERMTTIMKTSDINERVKILESLIDETGRLVQSHLEDVDITEQLIRARAARPGIRPN